VRNSFLLKKFLKEKILEIYNRIEGIYGFRRMTMNINRELDKKYSCKRIYRLMKEELKISSKIRRKKRKCIKSSAEYKAENILNREFTAQKPLEKVLTDITEFKYGEGKKVYMCATLDLYDRSILSYSISTRATLELVLETLRNSYQKKSNEKRILHSDRGSQFTSYEYKRELEKLEITHSMSRVGKCIDNGPMEGFWWSLKVEKYYLKKYEKVEELEKDIASYIKFYNEERLQKNLGERSPLEYRKLNE